MPVPFIMPNTTTGVRELRWGFTGLVLGDHERNGYDDSDFYAIVWDEYRARPMQVTYATTRFACEVPFSAPVDAEPWVREAAAEYAAAKAAAEEARTVRIGRTVRVISGKKTGEVGVVSWCGRNSYAPRYPVRSAFADYEPDLGTTIQTRWGIDVPGRERIFANGDQVELLT